MSGSFSRLSPFQYDSQSVPSSPAIGQQWLERNANGSIKERWEWNGTVWLSTTTFSVHSPQNFGSPNNFLFYGKNNLHNIWLSGMSASCRLTNSGTNDTNNYWVFSLIRTNSVILRTTALTVSTQNEAATPTGKNISNTPSSNNLIDLVSTDTVFFDITLGSVGSPSPLITYGIRLDWRFARR